MVRDTIPPPEPEIVWIKMEPGEADIVRDILTVRSASKETTHFANLDGGIMVDFFDDLLRDTPKFFNWN